MRGRRRIPIAARLAVVAVAAIVLALVALPPVVFPDGPAPAPLARYVPAAREQLLDQLDLSARFPVHLRFLEARCSTDGSGGFALLFEELRPPYLASTIAYTARRGLPTSAAAAWSGGFGVRSVDEDAEFVHLMGPGSVPCS